MVLVSIHSVALFLACVLKAASLPRDNDDFHFCYVSASDRRVRGVSTPFQFVSGTQNEWELLDPPTMNGQSDERDAVQQQQVVM